MPDQDIRTQRGDALFEIGLMAVKQVLNVEDVRLVHVAQALKLVLESEPGLTDDQKRQLREAIDLLRAIRDMEVMQPPESGKESGNDGS